MTIAFRLVLHPYIQLPIINVKRDTLIEHKQVIICEESEFERYKPFFSQFVNKNGRKEVVGVDLNHAN